MNARLSILVIAAALFGLGTSVVTTGRVHATGCSAPPGPQDHCWSVSLSSYDAGAHPDLTTQISVGTGSPASAPFPTQIPGWGAVTYDGLTPVAPQTGSDIGTISWDEQSSRNPAFGASNWIDLSTGQMPRCGDPGTLHITVPTLQLYGAERSFVAGVVSTATDPAEPAFQFDQEPDVARGGVPMGITHVPDWYDPLLTSEGIPESVVISLAFGIADYGNAHDSINVITIDTGTGDPFGLGDRYVTLAVIGNQFAGFNTGPEQLNLACGPLTITRTQLGVSVARTWNCSSDYFGNPVAGCSGTTFGGSMAVQTLTGAGTYHVHVLLPRVVNPDGDTTTGGMQLFNQWDNCRVDANPSQTDVDANGIGDACRSGGGWANVSPSAVSNAFLNCGGVLAVAFAPYAACQDADGDGILNADDNCPLTANPTQQDSIHDGIGDNCRPQPSLIGLGTGYAPGAVPGAVTSGVMTAYADICDQPFTVGGGQAASTCFSQSGRPVIDSSDLSGEPSSGPFVIPDFLDPGPGTTCIADHYADANHDGYSDADEAMPPGAPACTGAYPLTGGVGADPVAACPGRAWDGIGTAPDPIKMARADVNLDGRVNLLDASAVARRFPEIIPSTTNPDAELDLNGDRRINILDTALAFAFSGKSVPTCDGSAQPPAPIRFSGTGPAIVATAPPSVMPNSDVAVSFATTGAGFDAYTGYNLVVAYDASAASVNSVTDDSQGQLFGSSLCVPQLSIDLGGALVPPLSAFSEACTSLATSSTSMTGQLATVSLHIGTLTGATFLHMISAGAPDAGGGSYGTFTVNAADAEMQNNTLGCSGACGPGPIPGGQPWDVVLAPPAADLSVTAAAGSPVAVGGTAAIDLSVSNAATSLTASSVVLTNTLPPELDAATVSFLGPGAASCAETGPQATCTVGTLAPGETFSVTLQAVATTVAAGAQDCATATMSATDPTPEDDSQCATFDVVPSGPTIQATGPLTASVGQPFDVSFATLAPVPVTYRGYQVDAVYDTTMLNIISLADLSISSGLWADDFCAPPIVDGDLGGIITPPLAAFTLACTSLGAGTSSPGTLGSVRMTPLAAGQAVIHMVSTGAPDGGGGNYGTLTTNGSDGTLQLNALACAGVCGPLPPSAVEPWDVAVPVGVAYLTLTETRSPAAAIAGQPVTFSLVLSASADASTATGVVLTDSLGPEFASGATTFSGAGAGVCYVSGTTLSCEVGTLDAGQSFAVNMVLVPTLSSGTVTNCVTPSTNEGGVDENATACASVEMQVDTDEDGYSDAMELALGEDPNAYCAVNRADVNDDGMVNVLDLSSAARYFLKPQSTTPPRYLQGPPPFGTVVNILDLSKMSVSYLNDASACP